MRSPVLKAAALYLTMAARLPQWARLPLEPDAWATVGRMLANREKHFLDLMRTGVFSHPGNPYHQLFAWAGCAFGDLEHLVRTNGLEAALRALLKAGVYLEHDEFKGMRPVRRGTRELLVDPTALANRDPRYQRITMDSSSGSRSRGTIAWRSLAYHTYREAQERVILSEHEHGRELVRIDSLLPATGGIRRSLQHARRGNPPLKWFTHAGDAHYRALTRFMLWELRVLGLPVGMPEVLPPNDFSPVAKYLAARRQAGRQVLLGGTASKLVRVAAAALERDLDVSGARFLSGGETLTDTKRAVIERAGVEVHSAYTIGELGPVGVGCGRMRGNCVHVARDSVAVISRRRIAPLTETQVESLLFTSLLPFAAMILVNVEMDDAGIVGPAACGCPLARLGLDQQIDDIYSYGKLTGHGTSLLGSEILDVLERHLPARFGGVPGDYQVVEREGAAQTEIELRINPRLGIASAEEVRLHFLDRVQGMWGGSLTRRFWTHSESVRAVIAEPYLTGPRGKVHALHLLGGRSSAGESVAG